MPGTRFADVRRFAEIDSTNRYVLDEARAGAAEGLVAVADHQSAGRGRLGRSWVAPPGSALMVSVLFRPSLGVGRVHLLTTAVAVSAVEACAEVAGFSPGLKWPNDLVVPAAPPVPGHAVDRKLGGVLAEADVRGDRAEAVVVGLGLNLDWPAPPPELAAVAVALAQVVGRPVDREALLGALLRRLEGNYGRLGAPEGPEALARRYRSACVTLGRRVRVELGTEVLTGRATDVTVEGHLVVDADGGGRRTLTVGDVVHLR